MHIKQYKLIKDVTSIHVYTHFSLVDYSSVQCEYTGTKVSIKCR